MRGCFGYQIWFFSCLPPADAVFDDIIILHPFSPSIHHQIVIISKRIIININEMRTS
jgi:hypothetical protein